MTISTSLPLDITRVTADGRLLDVADSIIVEAYGVDYLAAHEQHVFGRHGSSREALLVVRDVMFSDLPVTAWGFAIARRTLDSDRQTMTRRQSSFWSRRPDGAWGRAVYGPIEAFGWNPEGAPGWNPDQRMTSLTEMRRRATSKLEQKTWRGPCPRMPRSIKAPSTLRRRARDAAKLFAWLKTTMGAVLP